MLFCDKRFLFFYFMFFSYVFVIFSQDKRQMKILMVVPTFPKIHDICMLNQITGLIDRGHDVCIYSQRRGDIEKVQPDVTKYNLLSKTIIGEFPNNLDDFDIIVFQLGHKAFDVKKTHNFKGKVVICLRGYDITSFVKKNPHAYDDFFNSCDLFMPVCSAFERILFVLGCDPKKIIVHYSGIDCSHFLFKKRSVPVRGTINIVSAGRFVEKKGFIYSIKAMARLIKKYPNIRYTIIGEGILKRKCQRLIKKLGLSKYVVIESWHTHDVYSKILDKSHIFIAPSVTAANNDQEGIPNVLKEAMATGLIVVSTYHSGIPEIIIDKISGLLVPERNSDAIFDAVDYIISHPEKWSQMQLLSRETIDSKFDNEKVNDKLEKIFLELINS